MVSINMKRPMTSSSWKRLSMASTLHLHYTEVDLVMTMKRTKQNKVKYDSRQRVKIKLKME